MSISLELACQQDLYHQVDLSPLTKTKETMHLIPKPMVSKKRSCFTVALVVIAIFTMAITCKSFSGDTACIEPVAVIQTQTLSLCTPYKQPPGDIYKLPLNESCQEKYLDHTSNNMCKTTDDLCSNEFNCPRAALVQFNPHATLLGFLSWLGTGTGTFEYVLSKTVKICQGEIFQNKVDYDISLQKNPIPGKKISCGEQGRIYPISAEGCVVDGNHGTVACQLLNMPIRVIRFDSPFFLLVENAKSFIHSCWNRTLNAKICHLTTIE